ncbi:fumarylacetoacetate hydrolase family protein [Belnapia sp. T6]|uniref:Fumarylacetoacetate hydrolase family protein n=1 Tax=Belnapia mucosa TaxID=2804532 RepID=A0ABS1V9Q4_9PROT|nr:fumarylacetoacetate hydrolase family protein [Belnapia mucosa]MBL6458367.1 fumarylacetoacetate hydrolase family protein [Belnapia mucosa]
MRLVTFRQGSSSAQFGIREGDQIRPIAAATETAILQDLAGAARRPTGPAIPVSEATLLQPVLRPGKVICIGLNYVDHAKEGGNPIPDYPAVFLRAATSLVGPGQPILRPPASEKLDYEAELAIIIGKPALRVKEAEALRHVAGYSCFNDGSLRDYQRKSTQWTMGKNFDATGAFGPEIVTPDELPEGAHGLRIATRLNGRTLQDGNTGDMIFSVARTIAILSEVMTLEPGDVIITGTPAGVGYPRKPPVFMQPGDTCEIEIEGIGVLSNPVAESPVAA